MSDPLLAQSAIDRLVASSYELVVEGQSCWRAANASSAPDPSTSGSAAPADSASSARPAAASPNTASTTADDRHTHPTNLTNRGGQMTITARPRWSLGRGKPPVPSGWHATAPWALLRAQQRAVVDRAVVTAYQSVSEGFTPPRHPRRNDHASPTFPQVRGCMASDAVRHSPGPSDRVLTTCCCQRCCQSTPGPRRFQPLRRTPEAGR